MQTSLSVTLAKEQRTYHIGTAQSCICSVQLPHPKENHIHLQYNTYTKASLA